MSLAIETKRIEAILLRDGKWHHVAPGSFDLSTYQFKQGDRQVLGGGGATGVSEVGATWIGTEDQLRYACPLSSIVAVKSKE